MKCQKCSKAAVVHLTEVVGDSSKTKRAVEMHLCLAHASEAGLVIPGAEVLPQMQPGIPGTKKADAGKSAAAAGADTGLPTGGAIVPSSPPTGGLTVVRDKSQMPIDPAICPVCGLTWNNFKQTGLMGCPHDYQMYESKLLPLLKRAQEGAGEHVGKVPRKKQTQENDRQVTSLRLRRELQKAIDAENYEQAARLRDQLRTLEKN
jgi:protein arginine kinase activator